MNNTDDALWGAFVVDRAAIEIAALFAFVMAATAWLAFNTPAETVAQTGPPAVFGGGTQGEAAAGAAWAIAEVAFASAAVILILIYRRLPEWVQEIIEWNIAFAIMLYLGMRAQANGSQWIALGVVLSVYTTYEVLNHYDLWWGVNNILAVAMAIVFGWVLGVYFGVAGLFIVFVLLTIYDHVFANKRSWMFTLGSAVMKARIPVLFIRAKRLRTGWDEVVEAIGKAENETDTTDEREWIGWGIGTADLMLPAAFVAAMATAPNGIVTTFGPVAVAVVAVGIVAACFRLRFEMLSRGSGAGLPALAGGALVPYIALVALASVV